MDRKTLLQTGLVTSAAKGRTLPRRCVAHVVAEGAEHPPFAVGARPVAIGAGRDCELILADARVSRRHAEVSATPEGIRVRDLGSTNGTFWQGSRVTEVVVPLGASIQIGGATIRFVPADTPSVPPSERRRFGGLVGASVTMRELFAVLELSSPTEATVLLEGGSGTGKEVAARAIHDHSPRASGPFVVVDCGALAAELLESHLYGHVRGAFTGAASDRRGAFVEASRGTLFLDEIGEMPLPSQARLLRALEARTVQPLGADRPISVDTRVIAATHRNLARMVEEQRFRFDLFYRLAVVHAYIPPLRERSEDLPILIEHFYEGRGLSPGPIEGANLERLVRYDWPGNVRELRNVLERAWALGNPTGARFQDLRIWVGEGAPAASPEVIDTTLAFKEAKERWNDEFERRYVAAVFEANGRNITHAADHAGLSRRHFRILLHKHGILSDE